MLSFIVEEGILTIGTISGIFTAYLLSSFKNNIIDPCVEKVAPIETLVDLLDDGKLNNSYKNKDNSSPASSPGVTPTTNQFGGLDKKKVKYKVFLRDFITWLIIIIVLYFAWKYFIKPYKQNLNSSPSLVNHFVPVSRMNFKGTTKN
jgi:large-conductance mechanosensitive channel